MPQYFTFSQFQARYPTDDSCLEEIVEQKYYNGIPCQKCKMLTRHYKVKKRPVYACKLCRNQIYPLSGTLFEKSTTPLRIWFLALFLMVQTHDSMNTKQLQQELGVTYKTAWRMRKNIRHLMEQNDGDLLKETIFMRHQEIREHKWVFFNKFEIKVVQKKEASEE